MKVCLEFEGEDERADADRAMHAREYSLLIWDWEQWIKDEQEQELSEEASKMLHRVRETWYELKEDSGIPCES
jgi:hypothetical protein